MTADSLTPEALEEYRTVASARVLEFLSDVEVLVAYEPGSCDRLRVEDLLGKKHA